MLSRLAESFFWMGRYLERAEGTTRLLAEFHQLIVQDQGAHLSKGCAAFLEGFGIESEALHPAALVKAIYGEAHAPSTILGSLSSARDNARSVRDLLPSDFYESMNKLHATSESIDVYSPGHSLRGVLERLAVTHGIYDWLAPNDESAAFFTLGRSLERMDLVSRLLNMHIESEWLEQGPATTLRAVGGLSTFLRARVPLTPRRVRLFLVTDVAFPRSLLQASKDAEDSIRDLANMSGLHVDSVLRPIGQLRGRLMYLGDNVDEVDDVLQQTIASVAMTSAAVRDHFFRPVGSIVWSN